MASAFVSLTLTPMLCARLPARRRRAEAGRDSANLFERGFDRVLAATRALSTSACGASSLIFLVFLGTVGADGLAVRDDRRRVSSAGGHRPALGLDRSAPGHLLRRHAARCSSRWPRRPAALALCRPCRARRRRRLSARRQPEPGPLVRRAEAARTSARRSRQVLGRPAPAARRESPGIDSFIMPVQNLRIGGALDPRASISSSCRGSTAASSTTGRSKLADAHGQRDPQLRRRHHRSAEQRPAGDASWSTATRRDSLGITADQLRSTLYDGFGTRQVSTIYTTGDSYEVIMEFDPDIDWTPDELDAIAIRGARAAGWSRSAPSRRVERTAGPLPVNQLGQLPAVTDLVQPAAGVALGDSGARDRGASRPSSAAARRSHHLRRHRQIFQDALANQGLLLLAARS